MGGEVGRTWKELGKGKSVIRIYCIKIILKEKVKQSTVNNKNRR